MGKGEEPTSLLCHTTTCFIHFYPSGWVQYPSALFPKS